MKNKNIVIIALKPGQLGNLLILYANFIANAKENNYTVYNPTFYEYADYFEQWKRSIVISYPRNPFSFLFIAFFRKLAYAMVDMFVRIMLRLKIKGGWGWQIIDLKWEASCDMNSQAFLEKIRQKKYSFIWGWGFRDDKNYIEKSDEMRMLFSPLEKINDRVNDFIEAVREEKTYLLIAIHIRHGDYKSFMQGKFFYPLPVYVDLMKKIEKIFGDNKVKFIIFSNARQDLPKDAPKHCFGLGHFMEDLYAMAQCDYIVGPPSTFSRWASYFGKKPLYCVYIPSKEITINSFSDEEYSNLNSFKPWPPLL